MENILFDILIFGKAIFKLLPGASRVRLLNYLQNILLSNVGPIYKRIIWLRTNQRFLCLGVGQSFVINIEMNFLYGLTLFTQII